MSLGVLAILQLILFMIAFYLHANTPMVYAPLQFIFILTIIHRVLSIFDPISFSAVSYVNIDSNCEHVFITLFNSISIVGYTFATIFLYSLTSYPQNWIKPSFIITTTCTCIGEILILGEYLFNIIFSHVLVEVAYRNYPLLERKPLSPWDYGIPSISFEDDTDSEMVPIIHGCSHNM